MVDEEKVNSNTLSKSCILINPYSTLVLSL